MLPKILRIRLDAVDRVSVAVFALVAMKFYRLFSPSPRDKPGSMLLLRRPAPCRNGIAGAGRDAKSRVFPRGTAASASYETAADQCVECAARRRTLFRKAVVMGCI